MSEKPLIRRYYSVAAQRFVWGCSGQGEFGVGFTPLAAYTEWLLAQHAGAKV